MVIFFLFGDHTFESTCPTGAFAQQIFANLKVSLKTLYFYRVVYVNDGRTWPGTEHSISSKVTITSALDSSLRPILKLRR
jgi:hypothetical protein